MGCVVKKYLVEISKVIEIHGYISSDTLETIDSFFYGISYYAIVRSSFLLSLTSDKELIATCNDLLAEGGVI